MQELFNLIGLAADIVLITFFISLVALVMCSDADDKREGDK